MKEKPNLFSFSTKELSQDAFLCWLLAWADSDQQDHDPALHQAGRAFVNHLLKIHKEAPLTDEGVRVCSEAQWRRCDVVAEITQGERRYALLIEDKASTDSRGNPLEKYRQRVRGRFPEHTLLAVYLKTGEQSSYEGEEKAGYQLVLRENLLQVLREGKKNGVDHPIFTDFLAHLENLDTEIKQVKNAKVKDWVEDKGDEKINHAWVGLYKKLKAHFDDHRIACSHFARSHRGHFWWMRWWYSDQDDGIRRDIEAERLYFRIVREDTPPRDEMHKVWHERIKASAGKFGWNGNVPLLYIRKGKQGTVVRFEFKDWLVEQQGGMLDLEQTIARLKLAEAIIQDAAQAS